MLVQVSPQMRLTANRFARSMTECSNESNRWSANFSDCKRRAAFHYLRRSLGATNLSFCNECSLVQVIASTRGWSSKNWKCAQVLPQINICSCGRSIYRCSTKSSAASMMTDLLCPDSSHLAIQILISKWCTEQLAMASLAMFHRKVFVFFIFSDFHEGQIQNMLCRAFSNLSLIFLLWVVMKI